MKSGNSAAFLASGVNTATKHDLKFYQEQPLFGLPETCFGNHINLNLSNKIRELVAGDMSNLQEEKIEDKPNHSQELKKYQLKLAQVSLIQTLKLLNSLFLSCYFIHLHSFSIYKNQLILSEAQMFLIFGRK